MSLVSERRASVGYRNTFRGTVARSGRVPSGQPVVCCLGNASVIGTEKGKARADLEMALFILVDAFRAVAQAFGL